MSLDTATVDETWSHQFSFAGVRQDEWKKKGKFWKSSALQIANFLSEKKNLGLRLGTGGGKTIIAILGVTAIKARTLFLTPTRYLTSQHQELLHDMLGFYSPSRVITGETPQKDRVWNDTTERFIFATGDIFYSAFLNGEVSPQMFDVVIFDEVHRARGRYSYVKIASEFKKYEIPRLGLSASPGSTQEEVELTLLNSDLEMISSLSSIMPGKSDSYHFLDMPDEMMRADEQGWKVLGKKLVDDLREANLLLPEHRVCSAKELKSLGLKIRALPTTPRTKIINKLFAKYLKYLYSYQVFMTGSYYSFLQYVEGEHGLTKRKRLSDKLLLGEPLFRRLIATAKQRLDEHPKVIKLLYLLDSLQKRGGRAIVFFADKNTATYCKDILARNGVGTETIFGGAKKASKAQHEVIESLKNGDITAILATSVLHEGVSIPEVDLVINYSVPQSGIVRLQSGGRTGRMYHGHVAHLVLDHDLDRLIFFSVHKETKKLQELSRLESQPHEKRVGQISLFVA